MMNNNTIKNTESEYIQQKNTEALKNAFSNMQSVIHGSNSSEGINAILQFLNEKSHISSDSTLYEQLKEVDERLNIKNRYVTLEDEWYTSVILPMLVQKQNEEWVAVLPLPNGECVIAEGQKRKKINRKNISEFSNKALCFYKVFKTEKISTKDLLGFIIKCISHSEMLIIFILGILQTLSGLIIPWANDVIFNKIIPTGIPESVLPTAALIFSAITLQATFSLLQVLFLTNILSRISAYIQSGIFARILEIKTKFFQNMKSGEVANLIMSFSQITSVISVRSVSSVINVILSFLYLWQIHTYAEELFIFVLFITFLTCLLLGFEAVAQAVHNKRYVKALSGMSGFCYEIFTGIEQIKLSGAEARIMQRWSEKYIDVSEKENKSFFLRYSKTFIHIVRIIGSLLIFLFGYKMSTSEFIAFSVAYGAFLVTSSGTDDIVKLISGFKSIFSLADTLFNAECEQTKNKLTPEKLDGEITISNLKFSYDENSPTVLNGVSMHINSGEFVGIVGTSGCGKSTLIRLLLGFESIQDGSIYIDKFDLRELNLKNYRKKTGTALQNSSLISGDIYSNIILTNPDATLDEVLAAVEAVQLSEEIASLPMGLHTYISENNCTLSGGQRQKILLARAIVSKPSILILDEATSALDNIAQSKIMENINKLPCTKLIIAHRLSTLENCDKIFVMDKGIIAQEGTFEELKCQDGIFKTLIQNQHI